MVAMKRVLHGCWVLLLVGLLMGGSREALGLNWVSNPGFEAGLANWNLGGNGSTLIDPAVFHGGTASAHLSVVYESYNWWTEMGQWVPVIPGKQYTVGGWFKTQDAGGSSARFLGLTSDYNDPECYFLPYGQLDGTNDWFYATKTFTVPAGVTSLKFYVLVAYGQMWVDDVFISEPTGIIFSPTGPNLVGAQDVVISCVTPDAVIRYTTDGTDPSETHGTVIASGGVVHLNHSLTIKARAWVNGVAGDIESASYTIIVNLLSNSGFEAGLDNWGLEGNGSKVIDTNVFHSGTKSVNMSVRAEDPWWAAMGQWIPVTPGQQYTFSGWFKTQGAVGTSVRLLGLTSSYDDPECYVLPYGQVDGTQDWTYVSKTITVPTGVTGLKVYIQIAYGTLWVDDIYFYYPIEATHLSFSPTGSEITIAQDVVVTCLTPEATIYYTTNGTDPSPTNGTQIPSGGTVPVTRSMTVKAVAVVNGVTGQVFSMDYTITRQNVAFNVPAIKAVKTDGDLSDWTNSTPWSAEYVLWTDDAAMPVSHSKAKFAYNDANDMLYVAIETDEHSLQPGGHVVVGLSTKPNGQPDEGIDAAQLGFYLKSDGNVEIINEIKTYGLNPACITTGVTAGCRENNGVWTYEIAIPLWKNWTDASAGRETLCPDNKVYVYSCVQSQYDVACGTNLTYFGNPAFWSGVFNQAATLNLQPHAACNGPMVIDPVVYYGFDNVAALGTDGSGNGYHATAQQSLGGDPATIISGTESGYFGSAAYFPQPPFVEQSYSFHNALMLSTIATADVPTAGFTVSAWVRPDISEFLETYELFTALSSTNLDKPACHLELCNESAGSYTWRLCVRGNNGVTITDLRLLTTVISNQWTHVVGVYDQAAGKVAIYIDGQELGSTTEITNIGMAGDWNGGAKIGATADWGRQFVGQMDEFYVFNRVLAPVEIKMLAGAEILAGDANGDGLVDVGDLGILAANYGGAGKTWPKGDFNKDGLVDVGDLGILAAHYGQGSAQALNFSDDYAKAFGTTAADDEEEVQETTSSLCSGLGLPLILGLALIGLLLVKLDE